MQSTYTKENRNIYFTCRKHTEMSRERAAELLNMSDSSLANHERNITKKVPVDTVVEMAELYHAPELKTLYCKECPIGKELPFATQLRNVESTGLKLISQLEDSVIKNIKNTTAEIFAAGVDECEEQKFNFIVQWAVQLFEVISELLLLDERRRCETSGYRGKG